MKDFAKLFNTDLGQILVMLEGNEEGEPEIRIIFHHLGAVLKVGVSGFAAKEGEEPWDVAQAKLDAIQEDGVYRVVKDIITRLEGAEECAKVL